MYYTASCARAVIEEQRHLYDIEYMSERTFTYTDPAEIYDFRSSFAFTALGEAYNGLLHHYLEHYLKEGDHVLELQCQSGIDTMPLAERGIKITATDATQNALNQLTYKAGRRALREFVLPMVLDPEILPAPHEFLLDIRVEREYWPRQIDAVYCGYGVLNESNGLRRLSEFLWKVLGKNALFTAVVKNRFCAQESLRRCKNKEFKKLFERVAFKTDLNEESKKTWYPAPMELYHHFQKEFDLVAIHALGFVLPPSVEALHISEDWNVPDRYLELEKKYNRKSWASKISDYYLIVLRRKSFARETEGSASKNARK